MKIIAGLDIGNGYVKGILKSKYTITEVDIPSGVSSTARPNFVPVKDKSCLIEVSDIFNRLDCSFISSVVPDSFRKLFGNRALSAGGSFEEFDVLSNRSKAQQGLSRVLVLGCIAGKALKDYVEEHECLPSESLAVEVSMALALPVTEYNLYRRSYAESFKGVTHTVNIHNFETPVTINIVFNEVQVVAEGASAYFAIVAKGEPLMDAMLADVRSRGLKLEGITSEDVLAAKNNIGIDIGEGTVNFPVFSLGRFNTDASTTFNKGYGSVLSTALSRMEETKFNGGFNSRKQLAFYLQDEPSPIKRNHYYNVKNYVDAEIVFFAKEVAEKFGHVLAQVGATTEVAYVYGGGATPVKEVLYPLLMDKVKEVCGDDAFPVLYLDSKYSRNLNREGLYLIASRIDSK